ncbi:MAG: glycyl-radical enzyme activating protein [Spirochaetota bacterium]
MDHKTGIVLEIQRMSTEDGPGIRTTVFMKGCPLRCVWCHNPESINPKPQVQWIGVRCIGCKACVAACPNGALSFDNGIQINRDICKGCGTCTEVCPSTAMELLGKKWDVDALVKELLKDAAYFSTSGGGVTISGGESTFQAHFVKNVLSALKFNGIHTALDTCGICNKSTLAMLLPHVDLVLYDLKEADLQKHIEFTGKSNLIVRENIKFILSFMKDHIFPREVWIRTPLIPGKTARDENIVAIAHFINELLTINPRAITRWDLCAFNNLCRDKYTRLGIRWELADAPLLTKEELEHFEAIAKATVKNSSIVKTSGSTRMEETEEHIPEPKKTSGCF